VVRVKVLEEGLEGRTGGAFDMNIGTVALLDRNPAPNMDLKYSHLADR
jgi:hypothetical protein